MSSGNDEIVYFEDVVCIRDTDLACLYRDETGEEFWVPKSILSEDSEVTEEDPDQSGVIGVPRWFAEKEGLV